jgi:hypothetical protein
VAVLALALVLGIIPAGIAYTKGHNFVVWWLAGAALFIGALPAAIMVKPNVDVLAARGAGRKCPFCAELVSTEAVVCRYCHRDLGRPSTDSAAAGAQVLGRAQRQPDLLVPLVGVAHFPSVHTVHVGTWTSRQQGTRTTIIVKIS